MDRDQLGLETTTREASALLPKSCDCDYSCQSSSGTLSMALSTATLYYPASGYDPNEPDW